MELALILVLQLVVAFSTGNIYGLTPAAGRGSGEDDVPNPLGEYAMSCLGRERLFDYFSRSAGPPVVLFRLNYACDLRYLVDLALRVWNGDRIDLCMGFLNVLWRADVSAMALRALEEADTPPKMFNVAGPKLWSVRAVCERLGQWMRFHGTKSETDLFSDARRGLDLLGRPRGIADRLMEWAADWVVRAGDCCASDAFRTHGPEYIKQMMNSPQKPL